MGPVTSAAYMGQCSSGSLHPRVSCSATSLVSAALTPKRMPVIVASARALGRPLVRLAVIAPTSSSAASTVSS